MKSFLIESYSQVAEDLLAAYYLGKNENITYIDVGCLWPIKFSNTYYFYRRNGSGLCIDPNPLVKDEFMRERPRDIFVNCGISDFTQELIYYSFENPVFNTFSSDRADQLIAQGKAGRHLKQKTVILTKSLNEILIECDWVEKYGNTVDFLTVDVEGFEDKVISSLNFSYVRPTLICLEEAVRVNRDNLITVEKLLIQKNYKIVGRTGHDVFYLDSKK